MILVDPREGSKDFLNPLRHLGAQATLSHLDAADFAFEGNGPEGPEVIGVERKTVNDLIDSMRGKRLSGHQVRLLSSCYDRQFLIVEGNFRPNPESHVLETRREDYGRWFTGWGKPIHFGEVCSYLIGLDANGIPVLRTTSEYETAAWIVWLWKYYQKPWEEHKSLRSIYAPPPSRPAGKMTWEEPNLVTKMAAQIPGVDQKAWAVGKKFGSVVEMVGASEEEWVIQGRPKNGRKVTVIGKVLAEKIVRELRGERNGAIQNSGE